MKLMASFDINSVQFKIHFQLLTYSRFLRLCDKIFNVIHLASVITKLNIIAINILPLDYF